MKKYLLLLAALALTLAACAPPPGMTSAVPPTQTPPPTVGLVWLITLEDYKVVELPARDDNHNGWDCWLGETGQNTVLVQCSEVARGYLTGVRRSFMAVSVERVPADE